MAYRQGKNNVQINIGIVDVLNIIPEFTGHKDEIEFVYFREGCNNAVRILGSNNDQLLLTFLNTKLKGNAYTRFALKLSTYENTYEFIKELQEVYAPKSDNQLIWILKMMDARQKIDEPLKEYGARFQELLQCAIFGIDYREVEKNSQEESKEYQIKEMEKVAAKHFVKNMRHSKVKDSINSSNCPLKNLMEIINLSSKLEKTCAISNRCKICFENGHSEDECLVKDTYNYYGKCHYCEENGHLEDTCPLVEELKFGDLV